MWRKLKLGVTAAVGVGFVLAWFFYDMIFPQVTIVLYSDTAAADMQRILEQVDEDVTMREGWQAEAEYWEVLERPTYLVMVKGPGKELTFQSRDWGDRDWFPLYRTDSLDELISYLKHDWNLLIWRLWLSDE